MTPTFNRFENKARFDNALKLVAALREADVTAANIQENGGGSDEFWSFAAQAAEVPVPSAETRKMVINIMEAASV